MPQLDFFAYSALIGYTFCFLLPWFIYIYSVIIPQIGYSLKLRNKVLNNNPVIDDTILNDDKTSILIINTRTICIVDISE